MIYSNIFKEIVKILKKMIKQIQYLGNQRSISSIEKEKKEKGREEKVVCK